VTVGLESLLDLGLPGGSGASASTPAAAAAPSSEPASPENVSGQAATVTSVQP
jgi:hypothetical protein